MPCGEMTKTTKKPCKAIPWHPQFSSKCRSHMTELERAVVEAQNEAFWDGYRQGVESASNRLKAEAVAQRTRAEIAEQAVRDKTKRYYTSDGAQIVEVGRYAYAWNAGKWDPLSIGDEVLVPSNWVTEARGQVGPTIEKVTGLGTNYEGGLVRLGRAT